MAKLKRRLTTKEAQEFIEREFRIFVTYATFCGWCKRWVKENPAMVKQPVPRGAYQIDKKLLREFFDGHSNQNS